MTDLATVYAVSVAVNGAALACLLAWLGRIPNARRQYCYPVVAVVGLSTATTALTAAGIGAVTVGDGTLDLVSLVDDLVGYSVLWVITGVLAGESRRTLAVLAAVPAVQVVSFNVAATLGGPLALVGLLVTVGGHLLIAYLLFGPVWERAQRLPDDQRLLHWKARNLLVFLIGMLIVFALIAVAGLFDQFVSAVIGEYMSLLIRAGFAGFLFANVDAIALDGPGPAQASGDAPDRGRAPAGGD